MLAAEPSPDPTLQMSDGLFHRILGPEATPAFEDAAELEYSWGRKWGSADEVSKLRSVMMRRPSRDLRRIVEVGESAWRDDLQAYVDPERRWYWAGHTLPDLDLLDSQFDDYVGTLHSEGVEVVLAPELQGGFTKATFTRDVALSVPGGAIITRLAPRMRRGEEQSATQTIASAGMPILGTITGTGLVEGGSFLKVGADRAFFGTSVRCNTEGYRQLAYMMADHGMTVEHVQMPGYQIHIDLCCLMIDHDLALINPRIIPYDFMMRLGDLGIETVDIAPGEDWACNSLTIGPRRVLAPAHLPRTAELLSSRHGVDIIPVAYDEMSKNGGGLHCSTIELQREW